MNIRDVLFIDSFEALQVSAAAINKLNGFTTEDELIGEFEKYLLGEFAEEYSDLADRFQPLIPAFRNARVGLKLMLITGELGETLEVIRKNKATQPDSHCPEFTNEEVELADVILRAMNYASDRHLRLAAAIVAKNEFNLNRSDHQPANRATEHGKKF